eukprot:jgi/Chlat1/4823/Chrsp31S04798
MAAALPSSSSSSASVRFVAPQRLGRAGAVTTSSSSSRCQLTSFTGLARSPALPLKQGMCHIVFSDGLSQLASNVANGAKWFCMRHAKRIPKLNLPADQRKALLRALTTEVLRHGRITTTKARAQAVRKHVEHMITLAKGGTLHQRRQALGWVYDKQLVHALFAEVAERYGERNGGYTRIIRTFPRRRGDNAEMAIIELV